MHVCAALLDNDGNVLAVGDDTASPANIDSDDSGTFDVSIDTSNVSDTGDIDQYELWVDALIHNPTDVTAPVVVGPNDVSDFEGTATPGPTQYGHADVHTDAHGHADATLESPLTAATCCISQAGPRVTGAPLLIAGLLPAMP